MFLFCWPLFFGTASQLTLFQGSEVTDMSCDGDDDDTWHRDGCRLGRLGEISG